MKAKISVIVPVYRVEAYLPDCVESLLAQTLEDIEIIVVDDGSPDGCGELAEAYARQDSRVRVIHQANMGLGPARNTGIEAAAGDYVAFVDGDDWVWAEMFEKLYHAALREQADIAVSGHCEVAGGRITKRNPHPLAGQALRTHDEIMAMRRNLYGPKSGERESFPVSVCMSIYRRSWLMEKGLRFRKLLSEDVLFNLEAYGCAGVITFTDGTDYCYRKEGQPSITRHVSTEKVRSCGEFLEALAEMAEDGDCRLRVKRTAIDLCRFYCAQAAGSDLIWKEKKQAVEQLAKAISPYWEGYSSRDLPWMQRLFHELITHGHYGAALWLCRLRYGKRIG